MRRLRAIPEFDQARLKAEFGRILSGWALDCLKLGHSGLDRPVARLGSGRAISPSLEQLGVLERPADDLSMIEWNPGVEAARA